MSLDSLPDEVLVKILYEPFVNDNPISTSIEAHDIYHAHLNCLEYWAEPRRNHGSECLNRLATQGITQRRPAISAHLLGVCKRWYRSGCPLFYRYNTFVVTQDDLAKFAKQIGGHNSTFLKAVNLTVHHQDLNPGEMMSLLPKTRFEHVETFNIILASRQSRLSLTSAGQGSPQDLVRWIKMRDNARYLRSVMYNQRKFLRGRVDCRGTRPLFAYCLHNTQLLCHDRLLDAEEDLYSIKGLNEEQASQCYDTDTHSGCCAR
jgi:hypothetical protein